MSRTPTNGSAYSYTSTLALNPSPERAKPQKSFAQRLFSGWKRDGDQHPDRELESSNPGQYPLDKGGGGRPPRSAWHGWKAILFDSWFNILIFLLPVAGILKATTEDSETLVFAACLLSMVPLVKLHDLATGVLSRRIGGSKTGLLNSSLSNIVELVIAVIALRKCELRVVQSSLIGAMLSKLLLILGMCFFAGGLKFSEQGFDSTATQIHSSLLSISVGAVLLPAAFHFALTYSTVDADDTGTSIRDQKRDILRMSHGVAIVLLFIYTSYLVFQLWSHTHLYQDNNAPSNKHQVPIVPVAASVRTATARVRQKGSHIAGRLKNANSIDRLRAGSAASFRTLSRTMSDASSRPTTPNLPFAEKVMSPVSEAPETSFDDGDGDLGQIRRPGQYMHPVRETSGSGSTLNVNSSSRLLSPESARSRLSLSPIAPPAESTVRLVTIRHEGRGSESGGSRTGSPASGSYAGSGSSDESFDSDKERVWHLRQQRGRSRSRTPISDVLSAYYQESLKGDDGEPMRRGVIDISEGGGAQKGKSEPEMSWAMTLLLLSCVTVLVAVNAEWMVDSMDHVSPSISKEWIGLILLPTVSALAECITAINVSVKDQLTLSISVAVGSTIQTALFVIPAMVILGWILDKPLALLFDPFESVVLYISVHTMGYVVADGKSNWLEGVILVCLYIVIAVTFWFYPGSNFSTNLAVCTMSPPIAIPL